MLKGYTGRMLRVDLSRGKVEVGSVDKNIYRSFIGGSGLAAWVMFNETHARTPALSVENPLVFTTGPFTGTSIPTSGRHSIASLSPLTGIWAESDVGGTWGFNLKRAGFDGIVVSGASPTPVYIWIHDHRAEIRDASFLWGKDTFKTHAALRKHTDPRASVSCIGPSGERLVRLASIMHDGPHARAAGRCGLGAVMGFKKLKAIVAFGNEEPEISDKTHLMRVIRAIVPDMVKLTEDIRRYGTSGAVEALEEMGDLPLKNWTQGRWQKGAARISGTAMRDTIYSGDYACKTCVIECGKEATISQGKYAGVSSAAAEHETVGTLGALCLVDDLEAISYANELCNRFGIDTISTGGAIAFAMEAYEKGIISGKDIDGLDLTWGNADAMVEAVRRIGAHEGRLGRLLGEGVRSAASRIGMNAEEFAVHVKGLELPAHDPRCFGSLAVGYATSNRGACHLQAYSHPLEGWITLPGLGYENSLDPHEDEGKGEMVAILQNLMCMFDALKLCKFSLFGGLRVHHMVEFFPLVSGLNIDLKEFMRTGERIFTLKRLFNCRRGIGRKDDFLPSRLLTLPRGEGGAGNYLPNLGKMLNEYYQARGWDVSGVPTGAKLREMGLDDL